MGGSGTFRLSMNYPDVYAAAYSLSGPPDGEETFLKPHKDDLIYLRNAKTLPAGDWELMMCVAALAAFSPDTIAPPFYVQFPLNDSGERIDSVWQKCFKL